MHVPDEDLHLELATGELYEEIVTTLESDGSSHNVLAKIQTDIVRYANGQGRMGEDPEYIASTLASALLSVSMLAHRLSIVAAEGPTPGATPGQTVTEARQSLSIA